MKMKRPMGSWKNVIASVCDRVIKAKESDPMLVLKAFGLGLGLRLVCSEIVPKMLKAIGPGGVRCEGAVVRGLGPLCPKIVPKVLKAMDQVEYAVKGQQFVDLDHYVQKLFQRCY
ncbi:hypothetical protein Tco_0831591 [Tanacetum coccineum]